MFAFGGLCGNSVGSLSCSFKVSYHLVCILTKHRYSQTYTFILCVSFIAVYILSLREGAICKTHVITFLQRINKYVTSYMTIYILKAVGGMYCIVQLRYDHEIRYYEGQG